MTLLMKRNGTVFPSILTDLNDVDKFLGSKLINVEDELLPYDSLTKVPSANVSERKNDFLIELAAPGLNKKDFKVELDNNVLSISAEKEMEKENNIGGLNHREFSIEGFCRTFRLPENSKPEKLHAHYENGILKIEIPKKEITIIKPKKEITVA